MKLGDSLGRSRRARRKSAAEGVAPPESVDVERASGDAAGPVGGLGSDSDLSSGSGSGSASTFERGSFVTLVRSFRLKNTPLPTLFGAAAGLALVGWFVGYMLATRVFFPAPTATGDLFEIPNLQGLGLASAGERLAGSGLSLGAVDSLRHPSVAAGLILGQSPLPGQLGFSEARVGVTISLGPQMRSVPDVLSLDVERARIVLETSGFVVAVETTEDEEPRGRVVDSSPPPDSVVALPAQIRLVVSTGPPVIPMPLVLGLELTAAELLLDSLGLVVSQVDEVFRFGRDQGIVVEQEPAADIELQRGGSVRLAVGRRGREREQ